jgi:hypothetical protein
MTVRLEDEALSFQMIPQECPIHYLDFGLITNLIAPLVQKKRRHTREQRKQFLIKKTLNVNLKRCFEELYRLSQMFPKDALIHKWRSSQMDTKKKMMELIDLNEIPLIYLEEVYQKQLEGAPTFVNGDWVKCKGRYYGVVSQVRQGHPYVIIKLVREIEHLDKHKCHPDRNTPIFHKWMRDRRNSIEILTCSVWECEKIGHDTPEWVHLRNKLIKDYNDNLEKRKKLWKKMFSRIIQHSVMDDPLRSKVILRSYHETWFQMKVNVLDKSMWENLKLIKSENPPCLHSLWWPAVAPGANIGNLRDTVLDLQILD